MNQTKEEKDSGDQKQWQWYWLKIHSGSEGGGILQQCWKIRRIKCNFKTKIYLCLWDNFGYSSLDPRLFQVPLNQDWLKYQDREMSGFFPMTALKERNSTYFFNSWRNFQLWQLEVGQQRVKLDGRVLENPLGERHVININVEMWKCPKYCHRH